MIEKIYISHCEKLKDRLEYINSVLNENIFMNNTELVVSTEEDDIFALQTNGYFFHEKWSQGLKNTEIFIAEQMFKIYKKICEDNVKIALILEDDFILVEDFDSKIRNLEKNLPSDFDCIFISSCCGLSVPSEFPGLLWESDTSRCTCGYLVTQTFCKKMIDNKNYFSPIDWHLNFIKSDLNFKYYWSKEILVNQGSEYIYKSNIK